MTNSDDAKHQLSPPKTPAHKKGAISANKQESKAPANNATRLLAKVITVLVVLIAMGSACYALYSNMLLRKGTTQQVNALLTQINLLRQQQIDTKAQVNTTIQATKESQDKLNSMDNRLQSALQQRLYQSKDWLLLKARYYLELAQINAHWSDNLQTTTALLQQADALLSDIHDQRLFIIRQTIAKEIAQLQTMPTLDLAGLLSQLDAAQSMITDLPLKASVTPTPLEKNTPTTTKTSTTSAWRKSLNESVSVLEKLIVVRHHDEEILPLPSPAYESMLREGFRLNLQEAQWAVLQNKEVVYQFSLAQAIKNINRSFEPNNSLTKTLIKQLQALQKIHLPHQKPILEQSLPLLNQLIESKDVQTPIAAGEHS